MFRVGDLRVLFRIGVLRVLFRVGSSQGTIKSREFSGYYIE